MKVLEVIVDATGKIISIKDDDDWFLLLIFKLAFLIAVLVVLGTVGFYVLPYALRYETWILALFFGSILLTVLLKKIPTVSIFIFGVCSFGFLTLLYVYYIEYLYEDLNNIFYSSDFFWDRVMFGLIYLIYIIISISIVIPLYIWLLMIFLGEEPEQDKRAKKRSRRKKGFLFF